MNEKAQNSQCPHCGSPIEPLRAKAVSIVEGNIVHFCSAACREAYVRPDVGEAQSSDELVSTDKAPDQAPATTEEESLAEESEAAANLPREVDDADEVEAPKESETPEGGTPRMHKALGSVGRPVYEIVILVVALVYAWIGPGIWNGLTIIAVTGAVAVAALLQRLILDRHLGASRLLESLVVPAIAVILILSSLLGNDLRSSAIFGIALLLAERLARLLEIAGRHRSGVVHLSDDPALQTLADSWQDNSKLAVLMRRMGFFVEWGRYPLAVLFTLLSWGVLEQNLSKSLLAGLAVLVVINPRLLRMVTGDAQLAAALSAFKRGINIRNGGAMEEVALSRVFLFLPRGTLLKDPSRITDWHLTEGTPEVDLLSATAAVCEQDDSPMGEALRKNLRDRGVVPCVLEEVDTAGEGGARGDTERGAILYGVRSYLLASGMLTGEMEQRAHELEASGQRAVFVAFEGHVVAVCGLENDPYPQSAGAIQRLAALGKDVTMLTDLEVDAASALAGRMGIDHVRFGLQAESLREVVGSISETGDNVTVVGHGSAFEEALPALGAALALGSSNPSQAAVTVYQGDVSVLPWVLGVMTRAVTRSQVNASLAFGAMALGVTLALVWYHPAVVASAGAIGFLCGALFTWSGPFPLAQQIGQKWGDVRGVIVRLFHKIIK